MNPSIAMGFAERQTPGSQYSHFGGTWTELLALIDLDKQKPGYRDGVVLIPVPPDRFYTSVVEMSDDLLLESDFKERAEGEARHIGTVARGAKTPARHVEIVLYHSSVLEEGSERTSDADWEVVSINASPWDKPIPMRPLTMARNFLVKQGGTKGEYTSEEFAESVWFWSQHVTLIPWRYMAIIGKHTGEAMGVCREEAIEDVLYEEPGATFRPISYEAYDTFCDDDSLVIKELAKDDD